MKKAALVFALLLLCSISKAQEFSGVSSTHKIESKIFKGDREIRVFTPYSYKETKDDYPVIYLFDGQFDALFDMTAGITDYMSQMGLSSEYIIVGIKTENRQREFTPMYLDKRTFESWGEESDVGNAKLLENHLKDEVFPLVEKNYRVKPLRLAIGHSLAGTFVLNTILSQPEFFKGIIAVSPNVSYDYEQLVDKFDAHLKTNKNLDKFIYVSAGTSGNMENRFKKSMSKLDKVIQYHNPEGLVYNFEIMDGLNHSQTPVKSIGNGLTGFAGILNITDTKIEEFLKSTDTSFVNSLKAFYTNLSSWVGYKMLPTSNEINGFGYECIYEEKLDEASKVFDWALELYPNDSNLYDSKGEVLEKNKSYREASVFYKKALDKLIENKENYDKENYDYYKGVFKKNLSRVEKL